MLRRPALCLVCVVTAAVSLTAYAHSWERHPIDVRAERAREDELADRRVAHRHQQTESDAVLDFRAYFGGTADAAAGTSNGYSFP